MAHGKLALRYAVGSDVGSHGRFPNEDSAFASPRLLAVADGMGGHAHGEVASAAVVDVLAELDNRLRRAQPADPLAALADAVARALRHLTERAERDPELAMMGSTLSALVWQGTGFGLAHVGDSRGYLLREGELRQITRDHTLVQSMVDEGRISETEAATHPRRSMLIRALQAGGAAEPDLTTVPVDVGDRVLLCSDGVTCVVEPPAIRDIVATGTPADAVGSLIAEAIRLASPDNITCVVADVVDAQPTRDVLVAGAATDRPARRGRLTRWLRR